MTSGSYFHARSVTAIFTSGGPSSSRDRKFCDPGLSGPLAAGLALFAPIVGAPQTMIVDGVEQQIWLQNAGYLWVPFILAAVWFALRGQFDKHKKLVKWVWPVWMYVSVTGVVIYVMLYQM